MGRDIEDIQSCSGFVNTTLMCDRVQKSVIYTDFAPIADPFLANVSQCPWYWKSTHYSYRPTLANTSNCDYRALTMREIKKPA